MDHFTKYAQTYITKSQTATVVTRTFWDHILVHYGLPSKILMDQDKDIKSKLVQELCDLAQVQKLHTTPSRAETNGAWERFNLTLISMLGTLPSHVKSNWQDWVTTMSHAYNCMLCFTAVFSSYFQMFGRHPILPVDIDFGVTDPCLSDSNCDTYVQKLRARLHWAYKTAAKHNRKEAQ